MNRGIPRLVMGLLDLRAVCLFSSSPKFVPWKLAITIEQAYADHVSPAAWKKNRLMMFRKSCSPNMSEIRKHSLVWARSLF